MAIFDFFRKKKKFPIVTRPFVQPEWRNDLSEDPYDAKIKAALGLKDVGKEAEAETLLRQIIEEKQEHVRAWYLLAEHFKDTNAFGRALFCYEKVMEFQPNNGIAKEKIEELQGIVRGRPDYLWEYNKEKGII
ncbi:MAG: hypothetical protein KAX49_12125 [Halanaerobiales bacterium]|nr:hypothetical protein [Halanaerobiales bacterium]